MTKQALRALKASIARWEKAAGGNNDDSPSSLTWPLCRLFAHKACDNCPVKQHTGQPYCRDTPLPPTVDSWRSKHPGPNEQYLADAQKELEFLESLLPKPTNNARTTMTVKQLIETLQQLDPEKIVVVAGYEGGHNEVTAAKEIRLNLNVNHNEYYGDHEQDPNGHCHAIEIKSK